MEIREIDQSNSHLVNRLVSDAFQYEPPHMFFHDFPVWGSSQVLRLGLFEGIELISHVGVRFVEMRTGGKSESVALIGAVSTRTDFRNKGLSSSLLEAALKIIDEKNCAWSFLWGSEHEFYGKLGFTLQGVQARGALSNLALDPKGIVTEPHDIKLGMTEKIFESLLAVKTGVTFNESDREWVWKHKTVKWFYLENPFAFIAYERGLDLKHIIHEFGGEKRGVEKLIYSIFVHDSAAQIIGYPDQLVRLGFTEGQFEREYLCLARPKNQSSKWNQDFWISGISAC